VRGNRLAERTAWVVFCGVHEGEANNNKHFAWPPATMECCCCCNCCRRRRRSNIPSITGAVILGPAPQQTSQEPLKVLACDARLSHSKLIMIVIDSWYKDQIENSVFTKVPLSLRIARPRSRDKEKKYNYPTQPKGATIVALMSLTWY